MSDFDSLLTFSVLIQKLGTTERFINKPGTKTRESLSEHCTQLAFTAWYLIDKHGLTLNKEKVFQYALVHDIAEAYTGDFPTHVPDFDRSLKEKLEKDAMVQIRNNYPDAPHLWEVYEHYETQSDEESRFVYALDKLLPGINIYLDSGTAWKERDPKDNSWSFERVAKRIQHDPLISEMWEELRIRIQTKYPEITA